MSAPRRGRKLHLPCLKPTIAASFLLLLVGSSSQADLVVDVDETWWGSGILADNVVNHGHVIGESDSFVIAEGYTVGGAGTFINTRIDGVFAPGNSPGISNTTNLGFGNNAIVQFELGGTTPGFDSGNHDQINDSAFISMGSNTTIEILPFGGFSPMLGDEFVVMTWQTGLSAQFPNVVVDPLFLGNNIQFELDYMNLGGMGDLTLRAVAVPEPSALLFVGAVSIVAAIGKCLWEVGRNKRRFVIDFWLTLTTPHCSATEGR